MFDERAIAITRLKRSMSSMHWLQPDELAALSQLRQQQSDGYRVFRNERGTRMTTGAIALVNKVVKLVAVEIQTTNPFQTE